jgi:hypothetical protein
VTTGDLQVTGGVLTLVGAVLFLGAWVTSQLFGDPAVGGVELARWLAVPAHILMLLGLGAIYLIQADRVGVWGLVGFLLAFSAAPDRSPACTGIRLPATTMTRSGTLEGRIPGGGFDTGIGPGHCEYVDWPMVAGGLPARCLSMFMPAPVMEGL